MKLGDKSTTGRGFELVKFVDVYGVQCSIQKSSGWDGDVRHRPGTSYLWLGVDDAEPKIMKSQAEDHGLKLDPEEEVSGWMPFPIPEAVSLSTRMHLSREQVQMLIQHLQAWLKTGSL